MHGRFSGGDDGLDNNRSLSLDRSAGNSLLNREIPVGGGDESGHPSIRGIGFQPVNLWLISAPGLEAVAASHPYTEMRGMRLCPRLFWRSWDKVAIIKRGMRRASG